MANERPQRIILTSTKSVSITILLTVIFGPLGMLYSTIGGAIVMLIITAVVGPLTLGFGLIFIWPICIIWTVIATNSYNKKLLAGQGQD